MLERTTDKEMIILENGACVPIEQVLALGLDPTTVTAQEYKNKLGNAINLETYRLIEIQGKRACMVKTAFRNALANIASKKNKRQLASLDQEIERLQQSILETEKNIASAKEELYTELKKNESTLTPLETYVKTVLHEPYLQESLLDYYKERIEELERIKQVRKEQNQKKSENHITSKPKKQASKFKLYPFHFMQKKNEKEQDLKSADGYSSTYPEEELAYRKQVYTIVNQFLDVSYGDEQGRKQFYNLISSCTNGYIAMEESSKTK